jgi:hypothetical protein
MLQRNAHIGKAHIANTGKNPTKTTTNEEDAELVQTAKRTLLAICKDNGAPASSRAAAARTLLELAGAIKNPQRSQPLETVGEATSDEIDRRLAALMKLERGSSELETRANFDAVARALEEAKQAH